MNGRTLAFLVRAFYGEKNKIFQLIFTRRKEEKPPKKYQKRKTVSNARELMHAT